MPKCSECGSNMYQGFVIDDETYCSEECRDKNIDVPYDDLYDLDPDSYYWTEWEDEDE